MPKQDINYNNSVIYKIQHQEKPELIYVGSTTDFTNRKAKHKSTCNNSKCLGHNLKLYKMIRDNEGWDAFKIMIIKEFPCTSKTELLIEEDKMMTELKSSLNCNKAHTTYEERKEYMKQYDEGHKEQRKEYREANKEKIKEQTKQYREGNKETIKEWTKQYYENNTDKIIKHQKEYIQANKEKISAHRKARYQAKKTKDEPIDI